MLSCRGTTEPQNCTRFSVVCLNDIFEHFRDRNLFFLKLFMDILHMHSFLWLCSTSLALFANGGANEGNIGSTQL